MIVSRASRESGFLQDSENLLPETLASGVRTFPHMLFQAIRLFGHAPAIVEEDGTAWSFEELGAQITMTARGLMALGIDRGDTVAIWAPNSREWIVVALALQMAGAALVPLNTRLKAREAGFILRTSAARVLFTVGDFLGNDYPAMIEVEDLPALEHIVSISGRSNRKILDWAAFLAGAESIPQSEALARLDSLDADDISDILFTSGTTGAPKGVMTCHGQNLRQYAVYSGKLGLRCDDRYLIVNPFFHVFGYKAGWLIALMRGATIYPVAKFDVVDILERIAGDRITYLPGPPTIFQSLLDSAYDKYDLSSLRLSITGSASVPVELVKRMHTDLGIDQVLTAYGLTESCGVVTMCAFGDDAETVAGTAGKPIPGIDLRLVNDQGNDVSCETAGEIWVRGDCVMRGYLNQPDETARSVDPDGWLHTGDIGVRDIKGNLRITGRKKDMFIVGGFNCYPAEIENVLLSHPDISDAAVIGVPDNRLGEVGKAIIVLRPGVHLDEDTLIGWCRTQMANYKVPRRIEIRGSLPRNASGKVEKFRLS
jgi:acyl-CoA synthetase (AMP-forming)/AMP-acid ligase II